jgi:hypothetical protein
VKVQPAGTELSTTTQTPITVRANMTIDVTVQDSGDSQETSIPVKLTIVQAGSPDIVKTATIDFINAGETKVVTFKNFTITNFVKPAVVKVEVQPVQGETNTSNNSADYPVIFSA